MGAARHCIFDKNRLQLLLQKRLVVAFSMFALSSVHCLLLHSRFDDFLALKAPISLSQVACPNGHTTLYQKRWGGVDGGWRPGGGKLAWCFFWAGAD
jgi:hypothetical protein